MTALLSAVFFTSGVAALVFETLWFRQAGLAFGNGVWASSLVLSSFMGGLALGNAAMARWGEGIRRPLLLYALLEVVIAVAGVGLVYGLPPLGAALAPLVRAGVDAPWMLQTVRLVTAFLLLLIPATAMGATLPIFVKALRTRDASFGGALGLLYGCNTLGAVAGAVLGAAWLVEVLGVRGTALAAAGLDLAAAAVALAVARQGPASPEAPEAAPPSAAEVRVRAPLTGRAVAFCAAAALGGATLLALEVVWFRFLHLFVSAGDLAFALMLAVVLAGIGLGGLVAGGWLRLDRRASRFAAPLALLAGTLTVAAYAFFPAALAPVGVRYVAATGEVLWLAAWLTLPTSLVSGMLFTLVGTALHEELRGAARATGLLTLANTLGAGLGSLLAGFVLLPLLGMERSFFLLAAAYAGIAACLLPIPVLRRRGQTLRVAAAGLLALVLLAFPFGLMARDFLQRAVHRFDPQEQSEVVAVREGRTETILYLEQSLDGKPLHHRLLTDGFSMSGTATKGRRYMKLFVYWPVALRPDPEQALLISYGVGSTAKALTDTKSLERIDVVDISREILEMSEIVFPDPEEHPLRDPRVHVHVEDGRFYLQTTAQRYDLITGEPPPPKNSGVVNLYTREYFQLVYDRLAEGGVATYWLPAHNLTPRDTRAIVRAFCDVFGDCSLWGGAGLDWMLSGSRDATWGVDAEAFRRLWRNPEVAPELAAVGLERPEQLGALFMADAEGLRELTRGTPPLTDDRPKRISEQRHRRDIDGPVFRAWMDVERTREAFRASDFVRRAWPPALREATLPYFDVQAIWNRLLLPDEPGHDGPDPRQVMTELHTLLTETPLEVLPMLLLGSSPERLAAVDALLSEGRSETPYLRDLAVEALARREFSRAAELFERTGFARPRDPLPVYLRIYALCMAGREEEATRAARSAQRRFPTGGSARGYWEWMTATFGLPSPYSAAALPSPRS